MKLTAQNDTVLLISFSGRTQELILLLPHLPPSVPVIAITSHLHPSTCPILSFHSSDMAISLPAPIHEDEESSFGLSAPTSSTTVALALGDALALATARRLHTSPDRGPAEVFKSFHPGGAIGAATAAAAAATTPISMMSTPSFTSVPSDYLSRQTDDGSQGQRQQRQQRQQDLLSKHLVPLDKIPTASATANPGQELRLLDILLTAIHNPDAKSWVSISSFTSSSSSSLTLIPPRHMRTLSAPQNMDKTISSISVSGLPFAVSQDHFLCVPVSTPLDEVRRIISESKYTTESAVSVVAGVDESNPHVCLGVIDVEEL